MIFLRISAYLSAISLLLSAVYFVVVEREPQKCSLTYMWEQPSYQRHYPEINASGDSQWYGLYHYSEGYHDIELKGLPVLFIPGNCGSYKQVRSLASVSLRMSLKIEHNRQFFDYFTVDLNEELSAISATIIKRQISYIKDCLTYISVKYGPSVPIVLVGHSMGGLIARAVVALSVHNVILILSLASPLMTPIVGVDKDMTTLYQSVNDLWTKAAHLQDVVSLSLTGGNRDLLVWDGYGRLEGSNHSLWLSTSSVKGVLASTDHLCITWCRELIIVLNRALHDSLVLNSYSSPQKLLSIFKKQLQSELPPYSEVNSSLPHYFSLFLSSSVIHLHHNPHFSISLPALYSPSRPLRLKVDTFDCHNVNPVKVLLFNYNHVHIHAYEVQRESVLLTLTENVADEYPVRLQLDLDAQCRYIVTVYASLVDWAAQIIKIHFVRVPSFISSLIILTYTRSSLSPLPLLLLIITVFLSSFSPLFSDLNSINLNSRIIFGDLIIIFFICLPLLWIFSLLTKIINNLFKFIPEMPPSVILAIFIPLLALISGIFPLLGHLILLLMHLFSLRRVRSLSIVPEGHSSSNNDHILTMVILVLFLLQLPLQIAEFHSEMQHLSTTNILAKHVSRLTLLKCYCLPELTLLTMTAVILLRISGAGPTQPHDSALLNTGLWVSPVLLASCSLLSSVIDTSKCASYLAGSVLLFESGNLFRGTRKI